MSRQLLILRTARFPFFGSALLRVHDAMGIPLDQRPELMWLVDPNDYLRPLVFDPRDDRWRK